MPTYQYACTNPACGSRFELVQSFTDPNASECPTCGGAVRKVFSAVGVVFKGSGFYRNDSRTDGRKEAGKKDSDSASKPEPSTSKPAAASADSASAAPKPAKSTSSSDSSSGGSSSSSSGTNAAAASA
jgi:putative FmdB family regulatory protein